MDEVGKTKAPWHLWVVGIVGVLWNSGGAIDYIQTQSGDRDYIGQAAHSYGLTTDAVIAYYESWPVWVHSLWAIAIWGSVLGCLLLLFKSRFALHTFIASLIGMTGTFIYRTINPLEGAELGAVAIFMTVVIFGVAALLAWYSSRMIRAGVLR